MHACSLPGASNGHLTQLPRLASPNLQRPPSGCALSLAHLSHRGWKTPDSLHIFKTSQITQLLSKKYPAPSPLVSAPETYMSVASYPLHIVKWLLFSLSSSSSWDPESYFILCPAIGFCCLCWPVKMGRKFTWDHLGLWSTPCRGSH